MPPRLLALSLAAALTLAGCAGQRAGETRKSERATAPPPAAAPTPTISPPQPLPAEGPIVSAPGAPDAPVLANAAPGSTPPAAGALAPPVPRGMLYVCARVVDGSPRHTGIDYEPKVRELCARHPEMGVCQYEREACRRDGGRVFDARGVEITKQIEAEYDRKVMRTRFRAG